MTKFRTSPLPDEHLQHDRTYAVGVHPPTRLGGNLQATRPPDPYHDIFSGPGPHPTATSIGEARDAAAAGGLRLPSVYTSRTTDSIDQILESPRRNSILNLLAVLCSYRAVTNNQAAALTGDKSFADPRSRVIAILFRAGLIDLTPAHLNNSLGLVGQGAVVYQLGDLNEIRRLHDILTWPEWFAVSGNRPLPTTAVNVRHDVLGAELALRVAVHLDIGTVLGPHFSTYDDLIGGVGATHRLRGGPDLTIVRRDGLRVAVEVTATVGQGFESKVERWGRILAENPTARSGLTVVFIAAPTISALRRRGDWPRRLIYDAVADAVRNHPGSHRDRTGERMGVATWQEWFPAPLTASSRFDGLTVDRPTGAHRAWEECSMLAAHERPIDPYDAGALRAVIPAAAMLGQTPPRVRSSHRPEAMLTRLLRAAAGPPGAIAPLRERSSTRSVGVGQGAAHNALIPKRLTGPAGEAESSTRQPVVRPTRVARRRKETQ